VTRRTEPKKREAKGRDETPPADPDSEPEAAEARKLFACRRFD
jgi:hypothetical protein